MSKDNGKINTCEKRELANLIAKQFDELISEISQQERHSEQDLLEKVMEKMKVQVVMKQITDLQSKIDFLKKKLNDCGFELDHYGSKVNGFKKSWSNSVRGYQNQIVDRSTPAGRIFYSLVKYQPDVAILQAQRQDLIKKIWLEEKREEVKKIVNTKPAIELPTPDKLEVK